MTKKRKAQTDKRSLNELRVTKKLSESDLQKSEGGHRILVSTRPDGSISFQMGLRK